MRELYTDAIEKVAESSYLQDFVAGVDPTGVRTFRNAMGNEKNHTKHKLIGDLGGFTGGAVLGALTPAALTAGASLALRKKMPGLSKNLDYMARGSLDAFNPKKVSKYVKSLPGLSKFEAQGSKVLRSANKLNDGVDKAEQILRSGKIKGGNADKLRHIVDDSLAEVKKFRGNNKELNELSNNLSKNYFDGKSVAEGTQRSLTALTTLGTAIGGGALNASSANMQYNTGLQNKKKND